MVIKYNDLPNGLRLRYNKSYLWHTQSVRLIRFGAVKHSSNPYFGTQEKQVEGRITRILGSKPLNMYSTLTVERDDSTVWSVQLGNFESYDYIDTIERE